MNKKHLQKQGLIQVIGSTHVSGQSQSKKRDTIKKLLKPQGYCVNGKLYIR